MTWTHGMLRSPELHSALKTKATWSHSGSSVRLWRLACLWFCLSWAAYLAWLGLWNSGLLALWRS